MRHPALAVAATVLMASLYGQALSAQAVVSQPVVKQQGYVSSD
jgi:hypothetical protein